LEPTWAKMATRAVQESLRDRFWRILGPNLMDFRPKLAGFWAPTCWILAGFWTHLVWFLMLLFSHKCQQDCFSCHTHRSCTEDHS
jgi:membrane glycosyltransferase